MNSAITKSGRKDILRGFRAVLFRMVPKHVFTGQGCTDCFRAVLFRMVPKLDYIRDGDIVGFRAVLFRMVPKHYKYPIHF